MFHVFLFSETDEVKRVVLFQRNKFLIINDQIIDQNALLKKLNLNMEEQLIFFQEKQMEFDQTQWTLLMKNKPTYIKIFDNKVNLFFK